MGRLIYAYTFPTPSMRKRLTLFSWTFMVCNDSKLDYWDLTISTVGGGYCLGNLDTDELKCRSFCSKGRFVVINVGYRLAPEFPWPTGIEDSYTTFEWVCSRNYFSDERMNQLIPGCEQCRWPQGRCIKGFHCLWTFLRRKLRYGINSTDPLKSIIWGSHNRTAPPISSCME